MIKEEIFAAINKSLATKKIFIISMLNHRNNRIGKEDRMTYEFSSHIQNGFAIPQYKVQHNGGQEYLDVVKFKENVFSLKENEIMWGLEAKLYSPHQNYKNPKIYIENSLKGPRTDKEKLSKYKFEHKIILLYQFEVIKIKGDFPLLYKEFPSLSYLGHSESEANENILSVKKLGLIDILEESLRKEFDKDVMYGFNEQTIGDNENYLDMKIHYFICEI